MKKSLNEINISRPSAKIGVLLCLVFLIFLFTPRPVAAASCWFDPLCYISLGLAALLALIVGFIGMLAAALVYIVVQISQYNGFLTSDVVVQGWNIVRDIANMFFVLVLLIISFGTILHVQQYQMKTLLPKVLLMAVLVNFSKAIAGLFIDFSQVIMLTFVTAYSQVGPGNFLGTLGLNDIVNIKGSTTAGALGNYGENAVTRFDIVLAYLLAALYGLVALVVIIAFLLILVVRIVMLWVLVVFSPLAYVLSVVPAGQKYVQQWWELFSKYVIIGPIIAFFLWLSLSTLPNLKNDPKSPFVPQGKDAQNTVIAQKPSVGPSVAGTTDQLARFAVSVAMLIMSLIFAQQVGGAVGKIAGNAYGTIMKTGMGAAKFAGGTLQYRWGKATRGWGLPSTYLSAWTQARETKLAQATVGAKGAARDVFEYGLRKSTFAKLRGKSVKEELAYERLGTQVRLDKASGALATKLRERWVGDAADKRAAAEEFDKHADEAIEPLGEDYDKRVKGGQGMAAAVKAADQATSLTTLVRQRWELENQIREQQDRVDNTLLPASERDDATSELYRLRTRLDDNKTRQRAEFYNLRASNPAVSGVDSAELQEVLYAEYAKQQLGQGKSRLDQAKLNLQQHESRKPEITAPREERERWETTQRRLLEERQVAEREVSSLKQGHVTAQAAAVEVRNPHSTGATMSMFNESHNAAREQRSQAAWAEAAVAVQSDADLVVASEEEAKREATSAGAQIQAIEDGKITIPEAEKLLRRIARDIELEEKRITELERDNPLPPTDFVGPLTPEQAQTRQAIDDQAKRRRDKERLEEYQSRLQTGGDTSGFNDIANREAAMRSMSEKERKEIFLTTDKEQKEKVKELTKKQKEAEIRATPYTGPKDTEAIHGLERELSRLTEAIKQDRNRVARSRIPDYYRQQAQRQLVAEELKKVQTRNAEELIRHFRDAQREGNKYKMEAVLQKLASDSNENEVLNAYGYSSDFEGYKKFFENEVKDHAGISEQEAFRIANDVSFINEERNHWNTARTVTVDYDSGQFKWKSEAEHVGEALAEIGKIDPQAIVRNLNRLAYGGEEVQPDGTLKFKLGALGAGILNMLQESGMLQQQINRMQSNIATNLYQSLQERPIPEFAKSVALLSSRARALPKSAQLAAELAMRRVGRI